jgi:hypothetical protein
MDNVQNVIVPLIYLRHKPMDLVYISMFFHVADFSFLE